MSELKLYNDPAILLRCKNPTLADFPALKLFFHMDDVVAGSQAWSARFGGVTMNYTGANTLQKDADGVFASAQLTSGTATGTMPSFTKYPFLVSVGRSLTAANQYAFACGDVGGTTGSGLSSVGTGTDGVNTITAPVITVPTDGQFGAQAASYDCIAPPISPSVDAGRVMCYANGDATYSSADITYDAAGVFGTVSTTGWSSNNLSTATQNIQRGICLAALDFSSKLPLSFLRLGVVWMAKNRGYLYPGFIGQL